MAHSLTAPNEQNLALPRLITDQKISKKFQIRSIQTGINRPKNHFTLSLKNPVLKIATFLTFSIGRLELKVQAAGKVVLLAAVEAAVAVGIAVAVVLREASAGLT